MFGIGMTEMIVIAVIALIFIGPDQIPEVARTVGRFLNDLRRSTDDIKRSFSEQAGLPRDLNSLDEWNRNRNHQNRQIESANHSPSEVPPKDYVAGAHDGLDASKLGHEADKAHSLEPTQTPTTSEETNPAHTVTTKPNKPEGSDPA